jgi:hypothetical protein
MDPARIQQFWPWYPDANLGVGMGGSHFAIESDGPKGEAWVQRFRIPPTPTVISRRGFHCHFLIPPGYTVKTTHMEEVDIIGAGDQVVGPGSVHASGHIYHWQEYLSLAEIEPAYPPEPLIAWMAEQGVLRRGTTQNYQLLKLRLQKAVVHVLTASERHPRLGAGRQKGGKTPPTAAAGRGFKTIFTPILETCGTPLRTALAELAQKPEVHDLCLTFLGLSDVAVTLGFGKKFLCRLPGHRERRPSASTTVVTR